MNYLKEMFNTIKNTLFKNISLVIITHNKRHKKMCTLIIQKYKALRGKH